MNLVRMRGPRPTVRWSRGLLRLLSEEVDDIEGMYEPYLLQIDLLQRTPPGRVVTRLVYEHLGIPFRPTNPGLF